MTAHPETIPIDGITIVREFDAPRESVFDAWVIPRRFAVWFGGNNGDVPIGTVELDATPGGVWKLTMFAGPDRTEINWIGEFVTVERPSKLVIALTDGSPADGWGYLTVVFDDLDGTTSMTFHQGGGQRNREELEQAKAGWHGFFDVLDELLRDAQLD